METVEVTYGPEVRSTEEFIVLTSDEASAFVPALSNGDVIMADPDQLWFWTDAWQEGERRVDEYIRTGDVQEFHTMEDFLLSLEE